MKKMMKLLLALSVIWAGAKEITIPAKADSQPVRILFTHDLNDHAEPVRTLDEENKVTTYGGYVYLSTAIKENKNENTVVLDAGNFSVGTMYGALNNTKAPDLAMMKTMGYDALTAGVNDFSYGTGVFGEMLSAAEKAPQLVAANLQFASGSAGNAVKEGWQAIGADSCTVIETENCKVGVFGLLGQNENYGENASVYITDPSEAAASAVSTLKGEGADLIVCLYSADEIPEEFTAESGIDVIIAGGSHSAEENYTQSNETVIVSSNANGATLGLLEIDPSDKSVVTYEQIAVADSQQAADGDIQAMLNAYKAEIQSNVMARFGLDVNANAFRAPYSLTTKDRQTTDRRYAEAADLVTDAMTEAYSASETDEAKPVSIIREDMITGTLFEGIVKANDLFSLASRGIGSDGIPGYNLVHVYMTGADLRALCEMDLMLNTDNPSTQFHFGRMRYEYSMNRPESNRIIDVYTEEADGYYIAATSDRMYPVITTPDILRAIPDMIEKTGGTLECNVYDETGKVITDYDVMTMRNADGAAIKLWSAMTSYMEHFDRGSDGIDVLPNTYKTARKQRTKISSPNVIKLFKHANSATLDYWLKMIVIPVGVLIGLNVLVWLINFKKKKETAE